MYGECLRFVSVSTFRSSIRSSIEIRLFLIRCVDSGYFVGLVIVQMILRPRCNC